MGSVSGLVALVFTDVEVEPVQEATMPGVET